MTDRKQIRKDLVDKAVQAYRQAESKAPHYDEQLLRLVRVLTEAEFEEYVRRTLPPEQGGKGRPQ